MEIKLNKNTSVDLEKLVDSKLLIQANSGGGKSWAIRRILEQSHGLVQHIILDPEGEFSTLREKYEYILAGKGSEVPITMQSAALLAHRLLKFKASAVIDLYELHPQDRKHFVRLFLEAMVNAPKDLWHPVLVVIDEAHTFCPEKGESEALNAVIGLASLGRKRGFGVVLATQRISKLHKDAAAECNNKMIGRTTLDIDRKRAGEEIGFTSKEDVMSLRALEPGEFYSFGPAISSDVQKLKVGEIKTSHPTAGARAFLAPIPPTKAIKDILAKLADLPQEAKKQAQTIDELKAEITALKRAKSAEKQAIPKQDIQKNVENAVKQAIVKRDKEWEKVVQNWKKYALRFIRLIEDAYTQITPDKPAETPCIKDYTGITLSSKNIDKTIRIFQAAKGDLFEDKQVAERLKNSFETIYTNSILGRGEKKILIATAQHEDGISREHLTVLTGYKRSSRDAYIQRLKNREYIDISNDLIRATDDGIQILGNDYKPLPTGRDLQDHLMQTLPEGERQILSILIRVYPDSISKDFLSEQINYQRSSRDAYLQRLSARKLVEMEGKGLIKASDKLF